MSLEDALRRAAMLDAKMHREAKGHELPLPHAVFSQLRAYLIRRAEGIAAENNVWQLLKFSSAIGGLSYIALGPTFDKGLSPYHFRFDSGARLSFGLTLREDDRLSRLVSARYHYQLPEGQSPAFFRFDLIDAPHENPLLEPCSHLHPGLEHVRLPVAIHDPIEVLDRIFFVIERNP